MFIPQNIYNIYIYIRRLLPRWFSNQMYVNEVEEGNIMTGYKANGKGGVTVSVGKRGGWATAFAHARKMAAWD